MSRSYRSIACALVACTLGVFSLATAAVAAGAPAPRLQRSAPVATPAPASGQLTEAQATKDPTLALRTFAVTDLQAALEDANAQSPPDIVAANCYTALIPLVQSGAANPLPKGLGAFQALQKARDLKAALANLQSPNGPLSQLNIACAPLVLDTQNTLIKLGIAGGAIVANPLHLPIPLPF